MSYSNLSENTKKVIEWIWMSTLIAGFLYGAGSFIALDLDVTNWNFVGRMVIVFLWTVMSLITAGSLVSED